MKHTPGPWHINVIADSHYVLSKSGYVLAKISDLSAYKEAHADNARLMAAAPDLLAALQTVERALIPMDYSAYSHADELADAIITARAAIAKAQGKPYPQCH